jgi:hypothetical protein
VPSAGAALRSSEALVGEPVSLVERQDGDWMVHYGPIELGIIDHRGDRLRRPKKACGFVDNSNELPTTPTGPTTTAASMNETGKLLPMSSVRSVTYVAGCSWG